MHQMKRNNVTIIFTTHDPEAASLIADDLVLMRGGQVIYTGEMKTTFTNKKLSETYGTPVEVIHLGGYLAVKSIERLE